MCRSSSSDKRDRVLTVGADRADGAAGRGAPGRHPGAPLAALRPAGRLGAVGVGRYSTTQPQTFRIASVRQARPSAPLRTFG